MTLLAYETKEEVFDWMYRIQIGRRNLTAIQKIDISLKMKPVYAKMAKERMATSTGGANPQLVPTLGQAETEDNPSSPFENKTNTKLAKIAGVGAETFRKGAKILESDNENLKQKVKSGNMSINAAYKELMGKQKPVPKEKKEPVEPKKDGISEELRKICEDIKTPKSNWFT